MQLPGTCRYMTLLVDRSIMHKRSRVANVTSSAVNLICCSLLANQIVRCLSLLVLPVRRDPGKINTKQFTGTAAAHSGVHRPPQQVDAPIPGTAAHHIQPPVDLIHVSTCLLIIHHRHCLCSEEQASLSWVCDFFFHSDEHQHLPRAEVHGFMICDDESWPRTSA